MGFGSGVLNYSDHVLAAKQANWHALARGDVLLLLALINKTKTCTWWPSCERNNIDPSIAPWTDSQVTTERGHVSSRMPLFIATTTLVLHSESASARRLDHARSGEGLQRQRKAAMSCSTTRGTLLGSTHSAHKRKLKAGLVSIRRCSPIKYMG
jgi:hypothetical protein